jgi:hypothetical protein
MSILVITNEGDATADYLIEKAAGRGTPVFRLNTEHLLDKFTYQASLGCGESQFRIADLCGREIVARELSGIWYRRPIPPLAQGVDERLQKYSLGEYLALIRGLWPQDGFRWMSHPLQILAAENKLHQLHLAERLGFKVPKTHVSNDRKYLESQCSGSDRFIMKALHSSSIPFGGETRLLYTSPLPSIGEITEDSLKSAPLLIQERIEKGYDVRLTVVQDACFAARVEFPSGESPLDWREASNEGRTSFCAVTPPEGVCSLATALVRRLGLTFGALDFVVNKAGDWYFLEINPNGQWAWLDPVFDGSISDRILNFLSGTRLL